VADNFEKTKCPFCGRENWVTDKICGATSCGSYLKSDIECLRSIDVSLRTTKRVAIWFLVLSILSLILGLIAAAGGFSTRRYY